MCSHPPCRLQQRPCPALNNTSAASQPQGASCLVSGGQQWQNQAKPPGVTPNLWESPQGSQLGRGVLSVTASGTAPCQPPVASQVEQPRCREAAVCSKPSAASLTARLTQTYLQKGVFWGSFQTFFFFLRERDILFLSAFQLELNLLLLQKPRFSGVLAGTHGASARPDPGARTTSTAFIFIPSGWNKMEIFQINNAHGCGETREAQKATPERKAEHGEACEGREEISSRLSPDTAPPK